MLGFALAATSEIVVATHTDRAEAAGEVRGDVVLEVVGLEQLSLDHIVEADLAHGHEDGPDGGPVGAVEELSHTLLFGHPIEAVDGVLVAGRREVLER